MIAIGQLTKSWWNGQVESHVEMNIGWTKPATYAVCFLFVEEGKSGIRLLRVASTLTPSEGPEELFEAHFIASVSARLLRGHGFRCRQEGDSLTIVSI